MIYRIITNLNLKADDQILCLQQVEQKIHRK
jgi:hypothetical protein